MLYHAHTHTHVRTNCHLLWGGILNLWSLRSAVGTLFWVLSACVWGACIWANGYPLQWRPTIPYNTAILQTQRLHQQQGDALLPEMAHRDWHQCQEAMGPEEETCTKGEKREEMTERKRVREWESEKDRHLDKDAKHFVCANYTKVPLAWAFVLFCLLLCALALALLVIKGALGPKLVGISMGESRTGKSHINITTIS